MNYIAKDSAGNMIGYENGEMIETDGTEIFYRKPYESTEFRADFIFEEEWIELDYEIFFHPETEWVQTEEPTM